MERRFEQSEWDDLDSLVGSLQSKIGRFGTVVVGPPPTLIASATEPAAGGSVGELIEALIAIPLAVALRVLIQRVAAPAVRG